MKVMECTFDTFEEFIDALLPDGKIGKKLSGYVYRGEGSEKFKLLPSALREENTNKLMAQDGLKIFKCNDTEWLQVFTEYRILRRFYQIANDNGLKVHGDELMAKHYFDDTAPEFLFTEREKVWIKPELAELAGLAQHYGVLTRMLDWSKDLFVALYFACIGGMKRLSKGEEDSIVLWAMDTKGIQVNEQHLYTCGKDSCPLKLVVPSYYANANLRAQKGVLSYWQITAKFDDECAVDRTPLDILIKDIRTFPEEEMYKFKLSNIYSLDLYRWLRRFGYTSAHIYPGYKGVVQQMEEDNLHLEIINRKENKNILGRNYI